jgi:hypothetical protein
MTTEPTTQKNRLATVALVIAICGLVVPFVCFGLGTIGQRHDDFDVFHIVWGVGVFYLPPVFGFISIVLALISRHQIKKAPGTTGKDTSDMATSVGCVTIALWFAVMFLHSP